MTKLRFESKDFEDRYSFAYIDSFVDGIRMVAKPVSLRKVEEEDIIGEPTFSLDRDDMQYLMDCLWDERFRPSKTLKDLKRDEDELTFLRGLVRYLTK